MTILNTRLALLRAKKLGASLRCDVGRRALRRGVLLGSEHRVALRDIDFSTLIDVGANRGQFALSVLADRPDTRVISFEPLDAPADVFEALIEDLDLEDTVTVKRLALGDRVEVGEMHISKSDDSSSLLAIGSQQTEAFPGTEQISVAEVQIGTLDEYFCSEAIAGPVLLKLDVQGAELRVLSGAIDTLPSVDYVYVEVSFHEFYDGQPLAGEIIGFLNTHGFSMASIGDVSLDASGAALQADLLFSRNKCST